MLAALSYPALLLPWFVLFCFASSPSLNRLVRRRRSPKIVWVLGALWGPGERRWLQAGRP